MRVSNRFPILIVALLLAWSGSAHGQQIQRVAGKLYTASTAADSICSGATSGSTPTCSGGITAGSITVGGGTTITSSTNIALLNVANTFTTNGTTLFTGSPTGFNVLGLRNTAAGTGNFASLQVGNDASAATGAFATFSSTFTTSGNAFADGSLLQNNGAGGLSIAANQPTGALRFYTGGATQRWGINASGDLTFGPSSHVAWSNGTPTVTSGGGTGPTVTGTDSLMFVSVGTGANSSITIGFGHAFANAPVCVPVSNSTGRDIFVNTSTTSITWFYGSSASFGFQAICLGS